MLNGLANLSANILIADNLKILVLTSRFPYPIEKGDKLRVYHQIRELSNRHKIYLCALSDISVTTDSLAEMDKYCEEIHVFRLTKPGIMWNMLCAAFKRMPLQVAYFHKHSARKAIQKIVAQVQPDHIFCQLIRMAPYVQRLSIPSTIDYMDNFSAGMQRRIQKSSFVFKPLLKWERKKVAAYERQVFTDFTHHTIISEQDRALLPIPQKEKVQIIPNGVDLNYFKPLENVSPAYDWVFVGNMGYYPNITAARFLVEKILPLATESAKPPRLLVAGARPAPEVRRLASEQVHISGWLEDIRHAYADGKIFVAPLFVGSGLQNKILEAMAMGIPCITTSLVNNAIGAKDGEEILLADEAEEFVAALQRLEGDQDLYGQIREAGMAFVRERFGWGCSVEELEQLFES